MCAVAVLSWRHSDRRSVRLFVAGLGDEVARGVGSQWVLDGEELPLVGNALERMGAAIGERDA
jgi:hypothetical protein